MIRGVRCLEAATIILCMPSPLSWSLGPSPTTTLEDVIRVDLCDDDERRIHWQNNEEMAVVLVQNIDIPTYKGARSY
jgi:hypothetical protein